MAAILETVWTSLTGSGARVGSRLGAGPVPGVQASLDYAGNPVVIIAPVPASAAVQLSRLLTREGRAA